MFPNLLCGIYVYFDRSQECRTDCAQFWRSLSQLQMEAFKPMVIVGYSCSRKEPGTGVGRSEILSFQDNLKRETCSVGMWRVPALCETQCCILTSNMLVPLSLCSGII